jgi:Fe2+ transport system protein FeoA
VDAGTAERWLKKLERGRVLKEGWPKCLVRLVEGALVVKFASPNPDSIEREKQRLENMGLEEGRHFTVKMPEGAATAMCISVGRALSAPPGFPYTALGDNGSWRLSL